MILSVSLFKLQALDTEQTLNKFHEVTEKIEQALNGISFDDLDISDEVKEQVEDLLLLLLFFISLNDTLERRLKINNICFLTH